MQKTFSQFSPNSILSCFRFHMKENGGNVCTYFLTFPSDHHISGSTSKGECDAWVMRKCAVGGGDRLDYFICDYLSCPKVVLWGGVFTLVLAVLVCKSKYDSLVALKIDVLVSKIPQVFVIIFFNILSPSISDYLHSWLLIFDSLLCLLMHWVWTVNILNLHLLFLQIGRSVGDMAWLLWEKLQHLCLHLTDVWGLHSHL